MLGNAASSVAELASAVIIDSNTSATSEFLKSVLEGLNGIKSVIRDAESRAEERHAELVALLTSGPPAKRKKVSHAPMTDKHSCQPASEHASYAKDIQRLELKVGAFNVMSCVHNLENHGVSGCASRAKPFVVSKDGEMGFPFNHVGQAVSDLYGSGKERRIQTWKKATRRHAKGKDEKFCTFLESMGDVEVTNVLVGVKGRGAYSAPHGDDDDGQLCKVMHKFIVFRARRGAVTVFVTVRMFVLEMH